VPTLAGRLADLAAILGYDWKDHEQRIDVLEAKVLPTNPRAEILKSTATNLANATETSIAFDTEIEDDWGFHTGANIWAVVPAGLSGLYIASFEGWYGSNSVNTRYTRLYRDRGGTVTNFASDIRPGSAGGVSTIVHLTEHVELQPGDKVWPSMYQNAGTGVTLVAAANTCRLKLVRIGNA
jgi:hypothetical protein